MRLLTVHSGLLAHHLVFAFYMLFVIDFSGVTHSYVVESEERPWRFLTIWNIVLQSVYFSLCILEDLMWLNQSKTLDLARKKIGTFLSFIFASLVIPIACAVVFNFWSLYFYDRDVIYPEVVDARIPRWINHSMHTNVLLAALLELWLVYRPYPKTSTAIVVLQSYTLSYLIVTLASYWVLGTWSYPFLEIFTWPQLCLFIFQQHSFVVIYYFTGKFANALVWGDSPSMRTRAPVSPQRRLSRRQD